MTLTTAGRDMQMKGMVVGPLSMAPGKYMLNEVVYVAPISDDMLLYVIMG